MKFRNRGTATCAVHFIRSIQTVSSSITSPDVRDAVSIITLPLILKASQSLAYKHSRDRQWEKCTKIIGWNNIIHYLQIKSWINCKICQKFKLISAYKLKMQCCMIQDVAPFKTVKALKQNWKQIQNRNGCRRYMCLFACWATGTQQSQKCTTKLYINKVFRQPENAMFHFLSSYSEETWSNFGSDVFENKTKISGCSKIQNVFNSSRTVKLWPNNLTRKDADAMSNVNKTATEMYENSRTWQRKVLCKTCHRRSHRVP